MEYFEIEKNKVEITSRGENEEFLCPKLEILNISFCKLSGIPSTIFKLTHLTHINLSNNNLKNIPEDIEKLHNLSYLNLSGNKLTSLPDSMKHIHNLRSLDLSKNKFGAVPYIIYTSLQLLKMLDLSFNNLSIFDCAPGCAKNVIDVKLVGNNFIKLPDWIFGNPSELKNFDISGNPIFLTVQEHNCYSAKIFDELDVLSVENCKLGSEKKNFLCLFRKLKVLNMGNRYDRCLEGCFNYLGNLTMYDLKNLNSLKTLRLQNVQISGMPPGLECLTNLQVLDLSDNYLSWLPDCACDMISLKVLNLASNQIIFLPKHFYKLENLQELHLQNNYLYSVPTEVVRLKSLEFLDFYNNKVDEIDMGIFKHKKLRGLDLEDNHLEKGVGDSDITRQYQAMKDCLRQKFNYVDKRRDIQTPKTPSVCEYYSDSSDGESEYDEEETPMVVENQPNVILEENWETESAYVRREDTFNPNEVPPLVEASTPNWTSQFEDNFCPAYSHRPSLREMYIRNIEASRAREAVEGQFDSD